MNKSDSERIATYLLDLGYLESESRKDADLLVLTTCGVRQSAEDRVYGLIPKIKKENKRVKILFTGCLSDRGDVLERVKNRIDYCMPIKDLPYLADMLGEKKKIKSYKDYLNIAPRYTSKISAFVPIGNGCDNFCTYCVVPYARGREIYRDKDEIISEVKCLAEKGYKEITLIAQNVNSYRSLGNFDFADLLQEISSVPGEFWLRFATSHPKDMSEKLIDTIANCKKVCEHIHLPCQAGDNTVLKAMNRGYDSEGYKKLLDYIYQKIPQVAISTDIIVGFPGETEEQFRKTEELFKYANFDMAYIARYSPRPGTVAEKLKDDVSLEEKKDREERLMQILRHTAFTNSKKFLDKEVFALIEGKNKKGEYYGKTRTSKNLKCIAKDDSIIGKIVKVKIDYAEDFGIAGKCLS